MSLFSAAFTGQPAAPPVEPAFRVPHHEPAAERLALLPWLRGLKENLLSVIPAEAYRAPIVSDARGPIRWHVLSSPSAFGHVFRNNVANYPKAAIMHRMLGPYLGQGIFLAEDTAWRWQRRVLAPVFAGSALKQMCAGILQAANDTADRLAITAGTGEPVQISFEMRVTAMDMVRHTMFTGLADMVTDLRHDGGAMPDPNRLCDYRADVQGDLDRFLQTFGRPGLADLLGLPPWCRPKHLLWRAPTDQPRRLLARLIADRRDAVSASEPAPERPVDMLDLMLAARDPETGRTMTDAEIRDNLLTFIITGSDTTALGLTWAIYVLTQQPEWLARLQDEADQAYRSSDPARIVDHLPLTRAFVEEVLRLFPPAALVVRRATAADTILGVPIRAGDLVLAPIYTLHRHPAVWPDPHRFDPNRFLDRSPKDRFAYMPFGAGGRACIGAGFAMTELLLALSTLVRRFDMALAPGWTVKPLLMLTLKPDGGLPVLLTPRARSAQAALSSVDKVRATATVV